MGDFKTVVIVEKNYLFQAGLESIILELPRMTLLKTFIGDEPDLVGLLIKQKPDILILNPLCLETPATSFLNQIKKNIHSVIFGVLDDQAPESIKSPFPNRLLYSDNKQQLQSKIRNCCDLNNNSYVKNQVLSARETTVLKYVVLGLTTQEIAEKLFLSIHTVATHRKNINKKLGIKTVSGLMVYALMNQLVNMEDMGDKI